MRNEVIATIEHKFKDEFIKTLKSSYLKSNSNKLKEVMKNKLGDNLTLSLNHYPNDTNILNIIGLNDNVIKEILDENEYKIYNITKNYKIDINGTKYSIRSYQYKVDTEEFLFNFNKEDFENHISDYMFSLNIIRETIQNTILNIRNKIKDKILSSLNELNLNLKDVNKLYNEIILNDMTFETIKEYKYLFDEEYLKQSSFKCCHYEFDNEVKFFPNRDSNYYITEVYFRHLKIGDINDKSTFIESLDNISYDLEEILIGEFYKNMISLGFTDEEIISIKYYIISRANFHKILKNNDII